MTRRIRVFVGSPGDVAEERERLGNVVRELNRSVADYFGIELRRAILERGDRHPLRLQGYAWHAAQAIHEGRTDQEEVWKEAEAEVEAMLHPGRSG